MPKKMENLNVEVTAFLEELKHPFIKEIEELRTYILLANSSLIENIKWNGPNYAFNETDCITMRIQPLTLKNIQVIFHQGAKLKTQPKEKIIKGTYDFLSWKTNDRAVATFKNKSEILKHKADLKCIIDSWLIAIEKDKN